VRKFVKTYLVRRRGQFTVIEDSSARVFEVWRWSAESGLEVIGRYPYGRKGDVPYAPLTLAATSMRPDEARGLAVALARALADDALRENGREGDEGVLALDSNPPAPVVDPTTARLGQGNNRGRRRRQLQEQP
jgi:hypothetical protein